MESFKDKKFASSVFVSPSFLVIAANDVLVLHSMHESKRLPAGGFNLGFEKYQTLLWHLLKQEIYKICEKLNLQLKSGNPQDTWTTI